MPVESTDADGNASTDASDKLVYDKNADGIYVCNNDTVPQGALADGTENCWAADAQVRIGRC